jgi:hypothetical protein
MLFFPSCMQDNNFHANLITLRYSKMKYLIALSALTLLSTTVSGHGSLSIPKPREKMQNGLGSNGNLHNLFISNVKV